MALSPNTLSHCRIELNTSYLKPYRTAERHGLTSAQVQDRRQSSLACNCSSSSADRTDKSDLSISRRQFARISAAIGLLGVSLPSNAFTAPPKGFYLYKDKLDGYSFLLPETWTPLSSSGNDIFFRNPYNVNENLFVNISSPSSSKYTKVDDLGPPEKAGEFTKQQYRRELMSTRIGVKRATEIVSASERTADDQKKYYDLELAAQSYGSRNQLAVSQRAVDAGMELEWERRYITVLGVANKRLYEFRIQTSSDAYDQAKESLMYIARSFRCIDQEES